MTQPPESAWTPVFQPADGYMGETSASSPADTHFLGTLTCSDCGVINVELTTRMGVSGSGPSTYHLYEDNRHLGSMVGDAPDLATAGLALWEAMLSGRDPRFLAPTAIEPGPLFTATQVQDLLARVDLLHTRAIFPERFPDLREAMMAAARPWLERAMALPLELLPEAEPSHDAPASLPFVGRIWEDSRLKVSYYLRREEYRAVLVQDRSPMQLMSWNCGIFRPLAHEVREVAACALEPEEADEALGALMLVHYRPDPRLRWLEGVPGPAEKGLSLLLEPQP